MYSKHKYYKEGNDGEEKALCGAAACTSCCSGLVVPLRQWVVQALQEPQEQGQDPAGPPGQAKGPMALPPQESELEP